MEIPDQIAQLTTRLKRVTEAGKYTWQDSGETAYSLSLSKGSVSLHSRDSDGSHPYILVIRDPGGVAVESYETNTGDTETWDREVGLLYRAAARSAITVHETVDELLKETESDDPDIPF